jgi:hypothetical protein
MRRLVIALIVAFATPASAQIAAAIGKPLPSPDLPPGEISVRVVAGSPANPVIGTDVTLTVNGTPRVARTDSAGRAIFKDLPAGASVQAKVVDEDKKDITSDTFQLPADSGARLLLSTKPFQPGGGAAPFAGGAMPEPRQMSGEPRPEQADAPGTFTVRVTYDDFKDTPAGVHVTLVGYAADNRVRVETKPTDKEGRATFSGLDRSGATAYFAMAQLPRNGAVDRLVSKPAVLDAQTGVRLVLSGEKRDSTQPPVDELARLHPQDSPPAAGKVRVTLEGVPEPGATVALVDAASTTVFAKATAESAPPDPEDVRAQAQFDAKPDVPAGTLDVTVHGGPGSDDKPLPDISVRVMPANGGSTGVESQTSDTGTIRMALQQPAGTQLIAVLTINGKQLNSQPFGLTKSGGVLEVEAHWATQAQAQVMFDVLPKPDQVFYAESTMRGQVYRSAPFQVIDGRGTRASLFVVPRILFSFSLTSHIDDQFLAVSGRFDLENNSWAPYVAGPDGLVIPLPRHHKGALVAERDQAEVSVAQGEGYRIARPIPPGTKQFHGAFSLPVDDGNVDWAMDLPLGAFQSGMEILQVPGMSVKLPPNVTGQTVTVPQGTFFVLPQIHILPHQSMAMSISGLPSPPAWRVWLPRVIGVFVVGMMLAGLGFALLRRVPAEVAGRAAREAKRQKLLDELIELEQAGKAEKRRDAIVAELEKLWD